MSAFATDIEKLRELDAGTRRAWAVYSDRLRELTGADYEQAERESWEELQSELRSLDRRRRTLHLESD
jgi:cell division septum initiation protein DivIVA